MAKEITFDKFVRWAGIIILILGILYVTNYLSSVLLPFFIAWFFAYLLYPVVLFIENKMHVRIRALSIIIAMLTMIAVIGGVIWLIIPPMIDQFDKLGDVLTKWLHQTTHTNNLTALIKEWMQNNQDQIERFLRSKDFSDTMKSTMPKLFAVVGQTANVLLSIIASMITLLYMFFILLDYETLTANWVRIFPKKNRPFWQALMNDVKRETQQLHTRSGYGGALHGHHVLYRFHHHRFPDGHRIGYTDRYSRPCTLSAYLCPDSYSFPRYAESCRHRTEFLVSLRSCIPGVLRGSGDYRYGGYT